MNRKQRAGLKKLAGRARGALEQIASKAESVHAPLSEAADNKPDWAEVVLDEVQGAVLDEHKKTWGEVRGFLLELGAVQEAIEEALDEEQSKLDDLNEGQLAGPTGQGITEAVEELQECLDSFADSLAMLNDDYETALSALEKPKNEYSGAIEEAMDSFQAVADCAFDDAPLSWSITQLDSF